MTWIVVYNRTGSPLVVDDTGRLCEAAEFTYADDTRPRVQAAIAAGSLVNVPITWNPSGSPAGIDPGAYEAAGEATLRNGGGWTPPPDPPARPYTLAQLDTLVRTGRLSESVLTAQFAGITTTPEKHGADPSGVADSTAAFEAMGAEIAGAPALVHLRPGATYRVASTVNLDGLTDVHIEGYGATIKADADTAYAMFDVTNTDGLTVRGVEFHGGRVGPYRPFEWGNYGWRLRGSAVNIAFDDCGWAWFNDSCIKAEGENAPGGPHPTSAVSKNLRVTRSRFTDTYHIAMLGKYGTATGLVFSGNILTRVSGPVEIDGQALETAFGTSTGNAIISGNVWTDCTGNAGTEGALIFIEENAFDVLVTGNTLRRITDLAGVHLDDGQTHKNFGRISIHDNNFVEFQLSSAGVVTANPYCILARVQATSTGAAMKDVSIEGNRFDRTAGGAIYVQQAAGADSLDNLRICGNTLVDVGCWGTINAAGNDMIRLNMLGSFSDLKVSGNTLVRRTAQLKSSSWLRIDGDRTKTQGIVMVSDNVFDSPTDNDPNPTYLNGLLRLVVIGNTMNRSQLRIDACDAAVQANRFLSATAQLGISIATACNVVLLGNSWAKDGSGTDYAVRVMQSSAITGAGNVMLGYTGNPMFLSSGTFTGTYQRELGATTYGEGTNIATGGTTGTKIGTGPTQKLGLFGKTPIVQPSSLTAADASTVDATYGTEEAAVINNLRTRLGQLETGLRNLGVLP